MTPSLLAASWRVVARAPFLVPLGFALLLVVASWPWLDDGYVAQVRVIVAIVLACALAACADDPASEVAAASPYSRVRRCATRLLVGLVLILPVAVLSLVLAESQVRDTPTSGAALQMLALLLIGPAIGFGLWAWGDRSQAGFIAPAGVLCIWFAVWVLPQKWSVLDAQPWGPPWEAVLIRWSALALLGAAVVVAAWREPLNSR